MSMILPIRTTVEDVEIVCGYLATKPTGASLNEARAVLDGTVLDGRKITAYKFWGLVEENGGKIRLTEAGRRLSKDKCARRSDVLREVVARVKPYISVVERAAHRGELTVTATEVAAYWHNHFKADVSESDKILNDQAVCFFQLAEGADLGVLTVGRKGSPTRFEFNSEMASSLIEAGTMDSASEVDPGTDESDIGENTTQRDRGKETAKERPTALDGLSEKGGRVFITHGKNKKILDQVKEIVAYGKFEPVVAQERETAAKPVPEKVMDEMRTCQAAVIHVGSEGTLFDDKKNEHPQINGNVLIEIGAAMALYGRNFILLVEEGVKLPSNLQGLYECRYTGDELNGAATMKLLKAFNEFK